MTDRELIDLSFGSLINLPYILEHWITKRTVGDNGIHWDGICAAKSLVRRSSNYVPIAHLNKNEAP